MELILEKKLIFGTQDVRTNVLLPFATDRDFESLLIRLSYAPKAIRSPEIIREQIRRCEDKYLPEGYRLTEEDKKEYTELYNFVTLSLDKNGKYIGCAHRHPPQQKIVISGSGSTWGFAAEAATVGKWRIVLHVQAVVCGTVAYELQVFGAGKGENTDELSAL